MTFKLKFTPEADKQLSELENNPSKKAACKAVSKCLGYMETNLRHNSLQTHEFTSMKGPNGEKVFESYAQHKKPYPWQSFFV